MSGRPKALDLFHLTRPIERRPPWGGLSRPGPVRPRSVLPCCFFSCENGVGGGACRAIPPGGEVCAWTTLSEGAQEQVGSEVAGGVKELDQSGPVNRPECGKRYIRRGVRSVEVSARSQLGKDCRATLLSILLSWRQVDYTCRRPHSCFTGCAAGGGHGGGRATRRRRCVGCPVPRRPPRQSLA